MSLPIEADSRPPLPRNRLLLLALGAVGVVYGDIGTSPLYTLRACFLAADLAVTPENVLGILSLIVWSLIAVVTVKYAGLVLRADNRGEGGILALLALLDPWGRRGSKRAAALIVLGMLGAGLLYGDGVLTPAISVLSAVEGLEVAAPELEAWIVPITVVILVALFAVQRLGTGRVGAVFGPITLVWFLVLAALGLRGIVENPAVIAALDPTVGGAFLLHHGAVGFAVMGAVFLCVTGAEALYADLGHFGLKPIRLAWLTLVLPALTLNYLGQGAMLLVSPDNLVNPFYTLAPRWALYPLIALATAATIIASQAIISGAFSLMNQAIHLGQSPRLKVVQTSAGERGQIYIPALNWLLMVVTIAVVIGFGSSERLAAAYGIAVSATMVITSLMLFSLARRRWGWPWPATIFLIGGFLAIDTMFFLANAMKVHDGGWLPLAIAAVTFLLMATWATGRANLIRALRAQTLSLGAFLERIRTEQPPRVPGTAVFLSAPNLGIPPVLQNYLTHVGALHERVVLVTVLVEEVPSTPLAERLSIARLGSGLYGVTVRIGYMQTPNVPLALRKAVDHGLEIDPDDTTYIIGRETLLPSVRVPGMALWREKLFALLHRNALRATDFYSLPPERTVEFGTRVAI